MDIKKLNYPPSLFPTNLHLSCHKAAYAAPIHSFGFPRNRGEVETQLSPEIFSLLSFKRHKNHSEEHFLLNTMASETLPQNQNKTSLSGRNHPSWSKEEALISFYATFHFALSRRYKFCSFCRSFLEGNFCPALLSTHSAPGHSSPSENTVSVFSKGRGASVFNSLKLNCDIAAK